MYFIKTPALIRHLVPSIVWKLNTINTVYLTFDDGPHPEITPFVLDTLKAYDAKGTFFCLGKQVEKHPELFARIKNEGHSVGNHTYSHHNGWKTTKTEYLNDTKKADTLIQSQLFRPPYGRITPSQKKHLSKDYKIIMWDILSGDFDQKLNSDNVIQNIVHNIEDGSIIVLHDSPKASSTLKETLPKLLAFFKGSNIKCDPLSHNI